MKSVGFEAVAEANARILILGTLPGGESLKQKQYYAKKTNSFWWIMGRLIGATPEMAYKGRLALLKKNGIALWDVCHSAERPGSLDSKIVFKTIVPNDFRKFLRTHRQIKLIAFNGQTAAKYFHKLLPDLFVLPHVVLPSTSPAHAGMRREKKLEMWRSGLARASVKRELENA